MKYGEKFEKFFRKGAQILAFLKRNFFFPITLYWVRIPKMLLMLDNHYDAPLSPSR